MNEFMRVPGFIVYKNRVVAIEGTGEIDLMRDVIAEVHTVEDAVAVVTKEIANNPDYQGTMSDMIYYEPGIIYI